MSHYTAGAPHKTAGRASLRHLGAYLLTTLSQLALRLICLLPLVYQKQLSEALGLDSKVGGAVAIGLSLLLWALLVLPLRYCVGGRVSGWLGAKGPETGFSHYGTWLSQGIARVLRILPFLLPLLAWFGAFYYYMNFVDFPTFFLMIKDVGSLIGGDYVHGVALLVLLLVLCAVLAYIGWRRIMPFFYLPIAPLSQDGERRAALNHRLLNRTTGINLLVALPPMVIALAVLALSLEARMTGDIQFDLMILLPAITEFDFPGEDLLKAGLVLAVLYLPFVLWRKTALAAAIHRVG